VAAFDATVTNNSAGTVYLNKDKKQSIYFFFTASPANTVTWPAERDRLTG
jgi:hypothetical protein